MQGCGTPLNDDKIHPFPRCWRTAQTSRLIQQCWASQGHREEGPYCLPTWTSDPEGESSPFLTVPLNTFVNVNVRNWSQTSCKVIGCGVPAKCQALGWLLHKQIELLVLFLRRWGIPIWWKLGKCSTNELYPKLRLYTVFYVYVCACVCKTIMNKLDTTVLQRKLRLMIEQGP